MTTMTAGPYETDEDGYCRRCGEPHGGPDCPIRTSGQTRTEDLPDPTLEVALMPYAGVNTRPLTNPERAQRAAAAVKAYAAVAGTGSEPAAASLTDLLSDLLHLADMLGEDPSALAGRAVRDYRADTAEQRPARPAVKYRVRLDGQTDGGEYRAVLYDVALNSDSDSMIYEFGEDSYVTYAPTPLEAIRAVFMDVESGAADRHFSKVRTRYADGNG